MMDADTYVQWLKQCSFSHATRQLITSIRQSDPVRRVSGRFGNLRGTYPSCKMGQTIQFERHQVELWAIYALEHDIEVLECYDQPERIPLQNRAKSIRMTTQWHMQDFFVFRRDSAGSEEWKPSSALDDPSFRLHGRYQRDGDGTWTYPPGEDYSLPLGLTNRVRSAEEFHPQYNANLRFLHVYWEANLLDSKREAEPICALVHAHPGISLHDRLIDHPDLKVDCIGALVISGYLFTDLTTTSPIHQERIFLYPTEADSRPSFVYLPQPSRDRSLTTLALERVVAVSRANGWGGHPTVGNRGTGIGRDEAVVFVAY